MLSYLKILILIIVFFLIVNSKNNFTIDNKIIPYLTENFKAPVINNFKEENSKVYSYNDGVYEGRAFDAFYGNVKLKVTVENGKIEKITFPEYPFHNAISDYVNSYALPILREETIRSQDSEVDIVTGASNTSNAFEKSLKSALSKAQ